MDPVLKPIDPNGSFPNKISMRNTFGITWDYACACTYINVCKGFSEFYNGSIDILRYRLSQYSNTYMSI